MIISVKGWFLRSKSRDGPTVDQQLLYDYIYSITYFKLFELIKPSRILTFIIVASIWAFD